MSDFMIVVDTPDLVDAVRRANSIAPRRGAALDKAAGILFEVQGPDLLVKATDLDTTVRCSIRVQSSGKGPVEGQSFRVPSAIVTAYISQLPLEDSTTQIEWGKPDESKASFTSGDCKATFSVITGDYPKIFAFDTNDMAEVDGLAHQLRRVSWACHPENQPLDGIYIDGSRIVGTDRTKLAIVGCTVPVTEPVTAPLSGVAAALRGHTGPVSLAVRDGKLLLSPDPDTQFATTVYAVDYPPLDHVLNLVVDNQVIEIDSGPLREALARINALMAGERYPQMGIELFDNKLHLEAMIEEVGRVEEVVTLREALPPEKTYSMLLNPSTLATAVEATSSNVIELTWPHDPRRPVEIRDRRAKVKAVIAPVIKTGGNES